MNAVSYCLNIPFKGKRSGVFPLTWGQHWVWDSVVARAPHYADLSGSYTVAVPDGCDMATVTDALTAILSRYETFRSRYSITPDGVPQQLVLAEGHIRVDVRDVDAGDAREAAATAAEEFANLPFTLPELSLRATVITSDDVPRFVVLCAFHMAMDCHGMVSVLDFLRTFMSGRSLGSAPDVLTHPADRAQEELGAKGVRRSERGVRYWKQELEKFPENPLPHIGRRPESPRYQTYAMHSSAVRIASLQLAGEMGVSTSSVILAMTASLLARRSGSRTCGIVLAASHRYDPDSMEYPGTLVQGVPAAFDVSGLSPHELISQCHRAGMLAALAGHCHPDDLTEMLRDSFGLEAAETRLACVANLNLPGAKDLTEQEGARATRAEVESLLARSRYEYAGGTPVEKERFYLAAHGDSADFFITLRADTAVLAPAEIVEFLRRLELLLVDCLPSSLAV